MAISLRDQSGKELLVNDEEQAKRWEALGYTRADGESKKAPAKKAASSRSSK